MAYIRPTEKNTITTLEKDIIEVGQKLYDGDDKPKLIKGMSVKFKIEEYSDIILNGKVSFQNQGIDENITGNEKDEIKSRCYVYMKAYLIDDLGREKGNPSAQWITNMNRDRHYEMFVVSEVWENVKPGTYSIEFRAKTHSLAPNQRPPVYVKDPDVSCVSVLTRKAEKLNVIPVV